MILTSFFLDLLTFWLTIQSRLGHVLEFSMRIRWACDAYETHQKWKITIFYHFFGQFLALIFNSPDPDGPYTTGGLKKNKFSKIYPNLTFKWGTLTTKNTDKCGLTFSMCTQPKCFRICRIYGIAWPSESRIVVVLYNTMSSFNKTCLWTDLYLPGHQVTLFTEMIKMIWRLGIFEILDHNDD